MHLCLDWRKLDFMYKRCLLHKEALQKDALYHCLTELSVPQISDIFVFRQEWPQEIQSLPHCGPLNLGIGSLDLLVNTRNFPSTVPWGPIHLICGQLKQRLNLNIQPTDSHSAD